MAWVVVLLAIIVGPIVWVFLNDRSGGAPRNEDEPNATGVTGVVRNVETGRTGAGTGGVPPSA